MFIPIIHYAVIIITYLTDYASTFTENLHKPIGCRLSGSLLWYINELQYIDKGIIFVGRGKLSGRGELGVHIYLLLEKYM